MAGHAWRLFVALPVPASVSSALDGLLSPLRDAHRGAAWTPADDRHITLHFIGTVRMELVGRLRGLTTEIALHHKATDVSLGAGGGRARRDRDGVAWLTVAAGAEQIAALSHDLAVALTPGVPTVGRRPHVTIARRASAALIGDLTRASARAHLAWQADHVTLYRSHLEPLGARYEPIVVAPMSPVE